MMISMELLCGMSIICIHMTKILLVQLKVLKKLLTVSGITVTTSR